MMSVLNCKKELIWFCVLLNRITPIPLSNLENELYFWQLASYFKGFVKQNKNLEIFIFDNIPHLYGTLIVNNIEYFKSNNVDLNELLLKITTQHIMNFRIK